MGEYHRIKCVFGSKDIGESIQTGALLYPNNVGFYWRLKGERTMASYNGEGKTVSEYKAEHKYMIPSTIYHNGKRITEKEAADKIVNYVIVQSGIVEYYTESK